MTNDPSHIDIQIDTVGKEMEVGSPGDSGSPQTMMGGLTARLGPAKLQRKLAQRKAQHKDQQGNPHASAALRKALFRLLGVHVPGSTPAEKAAVGEFDKMKGEHGGGLGHLKDPTGFKGQPTIWTDTHVYGAGAELEADGAHVGGDVNQLVDSLAKYKDGQGYAPVEHGRGDRYGDDNGWLGLNFMQQYALTNNPSDLQAAKGICDFLMSRGQRHVNKKRQVDEIDVPEEEGYQGTTTVSNAPAAQLATLLYLETRKPHYLAFAQDVERFLNDPKNHLFDENQQLYNDSHRVDITKTFTIKHGRKKGTHITEVVGHKYESTTAKVSYDEGSAIGMEVLLYEATQQVGHLKSAIAIAQRYLFGAKRMEPPTDPALQKDLQEHFSTTPDPSLEQRDAGKKSPRKDPLKYNPLAPIIDATKYNAIFFQNLLMLARVAYDPNYGKALSDYVAAYQKTVNRANENSAPLMYQASLVELLALEQQFKALDAAPPPPVAGLTAPVAPAKTA